MRGICGIRSLRALGFVAASALTFATTASAAVTTEQGGSIVVWPKVVWDGSRDTLIQVVNTASPMLHAHCFYVNAAPLDPTRPPSATNPPQWNETDFEIWLSRYQSTHWSASTGRSTHGNPAFGSDGAGFPPGLVPAVPQGFTGELKCIQIDDSGAPMNGNKLQGEATLRDANRDVSGYNAIALEGNPSIPGAIIGTDLELNYTSTNPAGEYSSCPNTLILNFVADGTDDPVLKMYGACAGGSCPVTTNLTLVPCQQDFENQIPGRVVANFDIWNEYEDRFSRNITVDCWLDATLTSLGSVFTRGSLGTNTGHARLTPAPGYPGLIGVAEETRRDVGGLPTRAAFNLVVEGNRFDAAGVTDHIVIPGL